MYPWIPPLKLLFLFPLLCACSGEAEPATVTAPDLTTALPGTWETVVFEVEYPTYMGSDTAFTERIGEADWARKYGVRPPSTVFTPDGKLRRTHRLRDGRTVNVINGLWRVQGDSLLVIEPNVTFTYAHELKGDRLSLHGIVDQDRDGQRDDRFRAEYRLVSRTN